MKKGVSMPINLNETMGNIIYKKFIKKIIISTYSI